MAGEKLIIQSCDENFLRYLNLSRPIHERYAEKCGADYRFFLGRKDPLVHPAWNRIPLFIEAFAAGYRKVVWLDGDSLVVQEDESIFSGTDWVTPLQMTRVKDSHVEIPWGGDCWDVYNDGVLVANNTPAASDAFEFVWSKRREPFEAHHHPTLWELNWLLDWLYLHPSEVKTLDMIWNWQPFAEAPPESDAVIQSWHGIDHEPRFLLFAEKFAEVYGAVTA